MARPGLPPILRSNVDMTASTPPNDPVPLDPQVEQRLIDLEIKASFNEDLLDHLNQTVIEQQRQIDWLLRELSQLRQQQSDAQPAAFRSLRDELPPHY